MFFVRFSLRFKHQLLFILPLAFLVQTAYAMPVVIKVPLLQKPILLDGDLSDWPFDPVSIPLNKPHARVSVDIDEVFLYAGHFGGEIFVGARWRDSTLDYQHKPYVWSDDKERYVSTGIMEDRFALQFEMEGEYDVNWLSGNAFKADMWHWKSSRSNPLGLAHDKMTIVSRDKITRSYKAKLANGEDVYIRRSSDAGDKLYVTKRYGLKESKSMPKYVLNYRAKGSVAEVKARSRWKDGYWNLELMRKLNTEHDDVSCLFAGKM